MNELYSSCWSKMIFVRKLNTKKGGIIDTHTRLVLMRETFLKKISSPNFKIFNINALYLYLLHAAKIRSNRTVTKSALCKLGYFKRASVLYCNTPPSKIPILLQTEATSGKKLHIASAETKYQKAN